MKLNAIDAAISIEDLAIAAIKLPGIFLKKESAMDNGVFELMTNGEYVFIWRNGNAEKVEIIDYH